MRDIGAGDDGLQVVEAWPKSAKTDQIVGIREKPSSSLLLAAKACTSLIQYLSVYAGGINARLFMSNTTPAAMMNKVDVDVDAVLKRSIRDVWIAKDTVTQMAMTSHSSLNIPTTTMSCCNA